nr:hypothetical protein [Actinoplanes polyasparticus]
MPGGDGDPVRVVETARRTDPAGVRQVSWHRVARPSERMLLS